MRGRAGPSLLDAARPSPGRRAPAAERGARPAGQDALPGVGEQGEGGAGVPGFPPCLAAAPRPRQEAGAAQEFRVEKRPGKLQREEAEAGRAAGRADLGPVSQLVGQAASSEAVTRSA